MAAHAPVLSFNGAANSDSSSGEEEPYETEEETAPAIVGSSSSREKTSWLKRLAIPGSSGGKKKELSIQSGDILRSPTSGSPPAIASPTATFPRQQQQQQQPQGTLQITVTESVTENTVLERPSTESSPKHRGGCYGRLFPWVHTGIKKLFYSIHFKRFDLPIFSIAKLLVNLVVVCALVGVCIKYFPPRINVSIESFGVPSHPAQVHWDAFQAANDKQFTPSDTSLPPVNTDLLRRRRSAPNSVPNIGEKEEEGGEGLKVGGRGSYYSSAADLEEVLSLRRKRSNASPYKECSLDSQYALHLNWEMDLVFRVPQGAKDDNILRLDRLAYVHQVEEMVYNSSQYKRFCHKRSATGLCDPLNSILTWLYPRDPTTGSYVYNTPDGFTPDLPATIHSLSANLSVALWFTGGEMNFVNSSYVEAKLLRSQIRVGLPLPCFKDTHDRREEQKELVTEYFVSLMSVFDDMSTR